ncbi:hypothetical protein EON82_20895 [bacterium]|nr:MAG: hypothetical protein EON82_20895 [bacterium]
MVEVLRIADVKPVLWNGRESRVLAFDLRNLLPLVVEEGPSLHWAAIPIGNEGTYILGNEGARSEEAFALGEMVDADDEGVPLAWDDLVDLTDSVLQTVWGTFVGVRDPSAFAEIPQLFNGEWRYLDRGTEMFYDLVEIAFQAVDSSFWLVWAKDEAVRERIRGAFSAVETISGMSRYEPQT